MFEPIIPPIPSVPNGQEHGLRNLKATAQDFAALFLHTLLRQAFRPGGFPGGGLGQEVFYDRLSWEYARLLSKRNDAGISKAILHFLKQMSTGKVSEK